MDRLQRLEGITYAYRDHKKRYCERCGFIPEHPCQLDVDHMDGDHTNDDPANLKTLCANCHRLKTWHERQQPSLPGRAKGPMLPTPAPCTL